MATRDVFSAEELDQLRAFPEINRAELIRHFTLTPADEAFLRRFRRPSNVFGAAVQMCTLPWLGFVPDEVAAVPPAAVARLSERLVIPVAELDAYAQREQTRTDHLREIAAYLGWRSMDELLWKEVDYPILLTVLAPSVVDVLDDLLLLFDQAISGRESHAKAKLREKLAERVKSGEDRQALLDEILAVLLDTGVDDEQVGMLIRNGIGMERLRAARAEAKPRLPRDHGHLAILDGSLTYLRKFTPNVLAALRFAGGTEAAPLLRAVSMLTELYATGNRKVPEPAPTEFVPAKWRGYLADAQRDGM